MAEVSSHQEEVAAIRESIEMIPRAMRHMGWRVSAEMMERWLRSPAWVLPRAWKTESAPDPLTLSSAHLDQGIVRMSWAMANPRIRTAMTLLRAKMINPAARALVAERLTKASWGRDNKARFGSPGDTAVQLDKTCQSNRVSFGEMFDTMDDLYGGIGKATLKVALIGDASRDTRTGRIALQTTHAGFYIRDTYDFSGAQYLGTWTKTGVRNKSQTLADALTDGLSFRWAKPSGHRTNQDFETYRRVTGFGGDFVLYSDVYWERFDRLLELN